jgi:hypothetical protein
VTICVGKTQLLVTNPSNRYLINSPMLPQFKKNSDGSIELYPQMDSTSLGKESRWLPAPMVQFIWPHG